MSWITDLDACASAGIIEFDAPAYIRGAQPRYFGNPPLESISGELPQMKQQPQKDEFNKNDDPNFNNPSWKKWLFGIGTAVAVGGAILTSLISKGKIKIPTCIKNLGSKVWNAVKAPFKWIGSLFKKAPTPPTP